MHDAMLVSVLSCARELLDDASRLQWRQRAAVEPRMQRSSGDVLQRQIRQSAMLADFVNLHDPRVLQLCDGLSFLLHARENFFARNAAGQQHFQSDDAIQNLLLRSEHDRHAATAKLFEQFVTRRRLDRTRIFQFARPVRLLSDTAVAQFCGGRIVVLGRILAGHRLSVVGKCGIEFFVPPVVFDRAMHGEQSLESLDMLREPRCEIFQLRLLAELFANQHLVINKIQQLLFVLRDLVERCTERFDADVLAAFPARPQFAYEHLDLIAERLREAVDVFANDDRLRRRWSRCGALCIRHVTAPVRALRRLGRVLA